MERILVCLLAGLLMAACSDRPIVEEDDKKPTQSGADATAPGPEIQPPDTPSNQRQHHTVMVVDNGFVLDHPVFQNKVVAKYSMRCTEHKLYERDFPSYQARKQDYLQNLNTYTNTCQLSEGISETVGPGFNQIAHLREQWNQAVRSKTLYGSFPNYQQVEQIVSGQDIGTVYHGTNTASLIAFQNPNVKLVIVQRDDIKDPNPNQMVCPTPERMSQQLQLAQDPEVTQALIAAGPGALHQRFVEIYKQYNVTIANHSYGSPSNLGFQERYSRIGCQYIPDWGPLMAASQAQQQQVENAWLQQGLVENLAVDVYAAGNDGSALNSTSDAFDCHDLNNSKIFVGALDANSQLSTFSNRGSCVSLYALGEDVVVAAPRGFLQITSGTSFSAPLTVRQMTLNIQPNLSPEEMTQEAIALAPGGQIPLQNLPVELAYMVPNPISQFALTGPEPVSPPPQSGKVEPLPSAGFKN